MQTYYVATLSHYVLVEAPSEAEARNSGLIALRIFLANRLSSDVPPPIRLVRLATADEIELLRWHDERLAELASAGPADGKFVCPYCDLAWEASGT